MERTIQSGGGPGDGIPAGPPSNKPVIVIKAGRTDGAVRAVAWHTAHVAGDDEVLESAFRRVGVLRVESIDELFFMSDVLSKQPLPKVRA